MYLFGRLTPWLVGGAAAVCTVAGVAVIGEIRLNIERERTTLRALAAENVVVTAASASAQQYGLEGYVIDGSDGKLFPYWYWCDKYVFINDSPLPFKKDESGTTTHSSSPPSDRLEVSASLVDHLSHVGRVRRLYMTRVVFTKDTNALWRQVNGVDTVYCYGCSGIELCRLCRMPCIRILVLDESLVKDADCKSLSTLQTCEDLSLSGCDIGDSGLADLSRLPRLKHLNVEKTSVSALGIARFRESNPSCTIDW